MPIQTFLLLSVWSEDLLGTQDNCKRVYEERPVQELSNHSLVALNQVQHLRSLRTAFIKSKTTFTKVIPHKIRQK